MKKFIKYLIIFWILFFTLVFFMGATRHILTQGQSINGVPKNIVIFMSSLISNVAHFDEINNPFVIKSSLTLKNGFNYSKFYKGSNDYLLVSSWDQTLNQSTVKLLRISDGKVLHKWIVNVEEINKIVNSKLIDDKTERKTKNTTALLHPFLLNDGSLIFGAGGIFKVDKNSRVIWSNTTSCHHSIETDAEGDFWICSYNSSPLNKEKYQIKDDAIKKIAALDGKVLFEKSVFEILMENGYSRGQFFINPDISTTLSYLDYMHLNDVQPVLTDSKFWKKGDVFISLRHQNLVFLYRPSTNKILWLKNGPWLKQHDVNVIDSTRISIFGNNVIDARFPDQKNRFIDGNNKQYVYDFSKDEYSFPYNNFFKEAKIKTVEEGRASILNDGNVFVEETLNGRLLCGNYNEEVWSYIERIDQNRISMFFWSRYITEDEFKKLKFIHP